MYIVLSIVLRILLYIVLIILLDPVLNILVDLSNMFLHFVPTVWWRLPAPSHNNHQDRWGGKSQTKYESLQHFITNQSEFGID